MRDEYFRCVYDSGLIEKNVGACKCTYHEKYISKHTDIILIIGNKVILNYAAHYQI